MNTSNREDYIKKLEDRDIAAFTITIDGYEQIEKCPSCRSLILKTDMFCSKCGQRLFREFDNNEF